MGAQVSRDPASRLMRRRRHSQTADQVDDAIYTLSRSGPALGRPLVDTITNSKIGNLKEPRPGSRGRSEVRILFVFDPWRSAILLVAGDKAGSWNKWYARMIPGPSSSMRST
ncbi:MAG TPA: type II toxin-antitoxin system RelE/ParE family toxin [Trebonia sp.]|nr:type II toxin-antitoxin system RelE/ParE family toxin [Trebonia sp.]